MFKSAVFILVLNLSGVRNEVSPDFNKCREFFFNDVIPSGLSNDPNNRDICQKLNNRYHFATLYNTLNKIPIYSAYRLDKFECRQQQYSKWFIEPQVSNEKDPHSEMTDESEVDPKYHSEQAFNEDYERKGYDRGHLYPRSYSCSDTCSTEATYTLTNAVPEVPKFNRGAWKRSERTAKQRMENDCNQPGDERYFITGAIPGNRQIGLHVNVPATVWTAACCVTNNPARTFSFGYYGHNVEGSTVTEASVADLQNILKASYASTANVVLFDGLCLK